jgi:hypothetical protein
MKKLFILGAFVLLSSTIISCTADEIDAENTKSKTTVDEKTDPTIEAIPTYADMGPDDEPVVPPPPPKK